MWAVSSGHHLGDPLELEARRGVLVDQQGRLPVGHAPEVLHGPEREVRDGDVVDLVARVGDLEVVLEEGERGLARLDGEGRQVLLARRGGDAQRDTGHVDRLAELEGADHQGHEVGRHRHGLGEADLLLAVAERLLAHHRAVGDGRQGLVDDQGHRKGGLAIRFVPTGKGPPGVGGLELRGGEHALAPVGVLEGAAVEAVQLVVELPREGEVQLPRPGLGPALEGERGPLLGLVECDRCGQGGPGRVGQLGVVDVELDGVEHDLPHGLEHLELDVGLAGEAGRVQVGCQDELVALRDDVPRQAVRRRFDHARFLRLGG